MSDKDETKGWCWIIARIPGGDFAFFAKIDKTEIGFAEMMEVKYPTQLMLVGGTGPAEERTLTYGLWGPAAIKATDGPMLLSRSQISIMTGAGAQLVGELEEIWGLKKVLQPIMPRIQVPGPGETLKFPARKGV